MPSNYEGLGAFCLNEIMNFIYKVNAEVELWADEHNFIVRLKKMENIKIKIGISPIYQWR